LVSFVGKQFLQPKRDRVSGYAGASPVDQWRAYYIDATNEHPNVLSGLDKPQRIAQHRSQLSVAVEELTQLARDRNELAMNFWDQCNEVFAQGLEGRPITVKLVIELYNYGLLIRNGMDWLSVDSKDAIYTRTARYSSMAERELLPLRSVLGKAVAEQAFNQLQALMALDEQRLNWVLRSQPLLDTLNDVLAKMADDSTT
ncbi:hypothetical protein, partial [Caballeronia concitans]|uniref:hypothetical protein n=1 Tax=Caballeronia concitans TaxID=1777133 RepID=UPI000AEB6680